MSCGPAAVPVAVGPGVQARGEAGEGARPEAADGLLAQGLVGEQEHPRPGVRVGAAGDGAPEHAAQEPVDLERRPAGQLLQVAVAQAAAACGDQAEDLVAEAVVAVLVGGQDLVELPLGQLRDLGGVGRDVQPADPAAAQGMVGVDVGGQRRVGPAGDDDPQPVRGALGQAGGDAGQPGAGQGPAVLVQAVDDQHQPPPGLHRPCRGLLQQLAAQPVPRRSRRQRRDLLAGDRGQLVEQAVGERGAVGLGGQARGDEERDHPRAGRGMQDQPGHQRGLARPRPGLPPHVRLVPARAPAPARPAHPPGPAARSGAMSPTCPT